MPEKSLRLDVPSLERLVKLASAPIGTFRVAPPVRKTFRDLYFETPSGDLARRGVVCRFRASSDDRRTITLEVRESIGDRFVTWSCWESTVTEVDPMEALCGESEAARRLRAITDPTRLNPKFELEVDQWVREIRGGFFPRTRLHVVYESVTAHRDSRMLSFQEIVVERVRGGGPDLEAVAEEIRLSNQLRREPRSRIERAEELLDAATFPDDVKHVAVTLVVRGSEIAFLDGPGGLRLPAAMGAGVEVSSGSLTKVFGKAETPAQLLGTVDEVDAGIRLQVWHASSDGSLGVAVSGGPVRWVSFQSALAMAGSPRLKDPDSLAALSLAARCGLFTPEQQAASQDEKSAAPPVTAESTVVVSEPAADLQSEPRHYINPDLSTLEFHSRVLEMAEDGSVPLLERLRFLSIFSSNLDEFFMVRVGRLKKRVERGSRKLSIDGMTSQEQLDAISVRTRSLQVRQHAALYEGCLPQMQRHGIEIVGWDRLTDEERAIATTIFEREIFPILTPQAITLAPGHPFPRIKNLRMALAVSVVERKGGEAHFGTVNLPAVDRFVRLPGADRFIPIEELIRGHLHLLYAGWVVESAHCFRVTRSGVVEIEEEGASSLIAAVEAEVEKRPHAPVVRLEVDREMPQAMRELLQRELRFEDARQDHRLGDVEVQEVTGLMDHGALAQIAEIDRPELLYDRFEGVDPLSNCSVVFERIAAGDLLVHSPYERFDCTVERFLAESADDDAVSSIRMTLYRTSGQSKIVDALVRAAESGKTVEVFVELKARFDEKRNIRWAKRMSDAGVHVVTGLVKLKTHAKTLLVTRKEGDRLVRYTHIGTGNFNSDTARFYTDLGLLTGDSNIGQDVNDLFNELMGSSRPPEKENRSILVAPNRMLARFIELIRREIQHAEAGRGGNVRVKINGLEDPEIIDALYEASAAGVQVELIVRGLCCLRPGLPGISHRIRVVSVLGRFLEHSRIYRFENAGKPEYFIGSADWRPRNLRKRVEVVAPVTHSEGIRRLDRILTAQLRDPAAWELGPDGTYTRRTGTDDPDFKTSQEWLMESEREN